VEDSLIGPILLFPVALAVLCLLLGRASRAGLAVAAGGWLYVALLAVQLIPFVLGVGGRLPLLPGLALEKLGACFLLLTAVVVACALSHAHAFFSSERQSASSPSDRQVLLFYVFALVFLLSMSAVYICDNLGLLWVSIEATTLTSAGLVYFRRDKHAIEATWKYLIICSVGLAFALLGTIFLFSASQHGLADGGSLNISDLIQQAPGLEPTLMKLGFIFCLAGYGTKAGVFPLHSWLPDAHSEAPAPASAMLSGSLLNCALFALWRLLQIASGVPGSHFCQEMTLWAGIVTVVAASLFLVRQHGLKRLWAYSSIENVGLMLVALGLGSAPLFLLQAVNHSVAKVSLFLLSGNIIQLAGTKQLSELRGLWSAAPGWAALFALSALAVTGVPPFGSFISEWLILVSSFESRHWLAAVLLLLGLSLAFIAVCLHAGKVLTGSPRSEIEPARTCSRSVVPAALVLVSVVLGLVIGPDFLRAAL